MIYFSEIKNKKVFTEDGVFLGRLDDLVFLALEKPIITKLVVFNKKNKFIIPTNFLAKINNKIIINKNFLHTNIEANELFILRNLLDKQIIDLRGNKVIRVNDVIIQEKPVFSLVGVDIGFLGIIRWLKIERFINNLLNIFNLKIRTNTLSWSDIQPLELANGRVKLKKQEEKLKKLRPEDLADYLESTSVGNAEKILNIINQEQMAEVLNNLNLSYQSRIFQKLKIEKAAKLIDLIDPDEAVDVLLTLKRKKREAIVNLLPEEKKKEINYLIGFSKTSLGEMMTTEYLVVSSDSTVSEIINKIKKETADFYFLQYVYVNNDKNQLIGVISLHDLLLHDLDQPVYKFMTQNVIVVHLSTPKEIVLKKMIRYKLQALPVIDSQKQILGIVTFDDLIESFDKKIIKI